LSLDVAEAPLFVGIDWAAEVHAVCVVDGTGRKVAAFTTSHTSEGLAGLIRRLARLGTAQDMPVAIERPDGRLVDVLLEAGHPVVPVKPNAIKAWRDAEVLSGAKSDERDAEVIAEYLRIRSHRLQPAPPYSAQTKALRVVTRSRGDVVDTRVAVTNQLSALLDTHWPGAKAIFRDVESTIALEFLTRYPTARHAMRLGAARLAAFCARHGYSGGRSGEELLARLRAAPGGTMDETLCVAIRDAVLALVGILKAVRTAEKFLGQSVIAHLDEHPDGKIFASLPRAGQINAAQILAEWGDCRAAYAGPDAIAALAGVSPVTSQSGKHRAVHFRWACNKRLRVAITIFAGNSRHSSPWAAHVYAEARSRGHDHPHAVRILARAWTRLIWRCWITHTPYDPARHGSALRHDQQLTSTTPQPFPAGAG
jgi:transposase